MSRIGLMIPHTDTTLERDLQRMFGGHKGVHTERLWLESITNEAEEAMLQGEVPRVVEYLRPIRPDVAVFGCTSAGALRGPEGEVSFVDWLEAAFGCPCVSAFGSSRRHLRARGGDAKVWLVTPYTRPVHETMIAGLASAGLVVRDGGCMGIDSDLRVGLIEPDQIERFVVDQELPLDSSDLLFVSCTNLRAAECVDSLSQRLGCPVTSSNLAILDGLERILDQ